MKTRTKPPAFNTRCLRAEVVALSDWLDTVEARRAYDGNADHVWSAQLGLARFDAAITNFESIGKRRENQS